MIRVLQLQCATQRKLNTCNGDGYQKMIIYKQRNAPLSVNQSTWAEYMQQPGTNYYAVNQESRIPVATAAFNDSAPPFAGIVTGCCMKGSTSSRMPLDSLPITSAASRTGPTEYRLAPFSRAPYTGTGAPDNTPGRCVYQTGTLKMLPMVA